MIDRQLIEFVLDFLDSYFRDTSMHQTYLTGIENKEELCDAICLAYFHKATEEIDDSEYKMKLH